MLKLAAIATHVLSVLASSAPVECWFSAVGNIFRPDRCQMKDTTFERLIFIECNKDNQLSQFANDELKTYSIK